MIRMTGTRGFLDSQHGWLFWRGVYWIPFGSGAKGWQQTFEEVEIQTDIIYMGTGNY